MRFEREFNERFAFDFKDFSSSFRPWNRTKEELGYYLSTQYQRVVGNGSSFSLDCNKYCLVDDKRRVVVIPAKTKMNAFRTLNGGIVAVYDRKCYETNLQPVPKGIKPNLWNSKWKPSLNGSLLLIILGDNMLFLAGEKRWEQITE